jgi:hypothetical protein
VKVRRYIANRPCPEIRGQDHVPLQPRYKSLFRLARAHAARRLLRLHRRRANGGSQQVVPESIRASGLGVLTTAIAIARLLASVAFGAMWSLIGLQSTILIFIAALLLSIVFTSRLWFLLERDV